MKVRENIVAFIYTRIPEISFLLLKRTMNRGGFWQPVSDAIENEEEPIQTVKRELFEETGTTNIMSISV
ncbi:8-oxo-dGTP pyrophosphatase MutT (NUDIX family) [Sporosarcina luteola]|nr:8-oxo-dGTP pyrophosphatase MutT (NUDIX family) [Sporosarcina luteola]